MAPIYFLPLMWGYLTRGRYQGREGGQKLKLYKTITNEPTY